MDTEQKTPQKTKTEDAQTRAPTSADAIGLEEIVILANKIGLEYSDAKHELDRLELMRPTIKSRIALELYQTEKMSETMLRRMTETHTDYLEYLEQLLNAKQKAEKLKIRYDSYKNLFDAKRSLLSYQKAEMSLL